MYVMKLIRHAFTALRSTSHHPGQNMTEIGWQTSSIHMVVMNGLAACVCHCHANSRLSQTGQLYRRQWGEVCQQWWWERWKYGNLRVIAQARSG